MAEYAPDPNTIDYDNLPPLVRKGEDRQKVIRKIIDDWLPPQDKPNTAAPTQSTSEDISTEQIHISKPIVRKALIDENTNEAIDLGELITTLNDRIKTCDLEPHSRVFANLHGCRIDKFCVAQHSSFGILCYACKFTCETKIDLCNLKHADFRKSIFASTAEFSIVTFATEAWFQSARFLGLTTFLYCNFKHPPSFKDCFFRNGLFFTNSKSKNPISFANSTLYCTAQSRSEIHLPDQPITQGYDFRSAHVHNTRLTGNFSNTRFHNGPNTSATFGLPKPEKGRQAFLWAATTGPKRFLTWNLVRAFGSLHILARTSAAALVIVPLLAALWPIIRKGIYTYVDLTDDSSLLPANMHWAWAALFFAALFVLIGNIIYQSACPEFVRERSRQQVIDDEMDDFRKYPNERDRRLQEAIDWIKRAAEKLPYDRHENLVRYHGNTVWIPQKLEWLTGDIEDEWDEEDPPSEYRNESWLNANKPQPVMSRRSRQDIAIQVGAQSHYDIEARTEQGLAMCAFTFYLLATGLTIWVIEHQAFQILLQSGTPLLACIMRFGIILLASIVVLGIALVPFYHAWLRHMFPSQT